MPVRASTVGAAAILLVIAVASQAARFLPPTFRLRHRILSVLDEATLVSLGIVAFLAALVVAATALVTRGPIGATKAPPRRSRFSPSLRRRRPVVAVG